MVGIKFPDFKKSLGEYTRAIADGEDVPIMLPECE